MSLTVALLSISPQLEARITDTGEGSRSVHTTMSTPGAPFCTLINVYKAERKAHTSIWVLKLKQKYCSTHTRAYFQTTSGKSILILVYKRQHLVNANSALI